MHQHTIFATMQSLPSLVTTIAVFLLCGFCKEKCTTFNTQRRFMVFPTLAQDK